MKEFDKKTLEKVYELLDKTKRYSFMDDIVSVLADVAILVRIVEDVEISEYGVGTDRGWFKFREFEEFVYDKLEEMGIVQYE